MNKAREVIDHYFSVYLGLSVSQVKPGEVVPVSCKRRQKPEVGWGYAVAIWAQVFRGRAVISVPPGLFLALRRLLAERPTPLQLSTLVWRKKMGSLLGREEIGGLQRVLYCDEKQLQPFRIPECRRLRVSDVGRFVEMKLHLNPNCDPDALARDIKRNITDGIAFGVFLKGKLVSVSDAPAIGPMHDEIEEVGVETSPNCLRRGYGKAVVSATTRAIWDLGRIPICRCSSKNDASNRLARHVGYVKYADSIEFRAS
jgi:hypothetical protein